MNLKKRVHSKLSGERSIDISGVVSSAKKRAMERSQRARDGWKPNLVVGIHDSSSFSMNVVPIIGTADRKHGWSPFGQRPNPGTLLDRDERYSILIVVVNLRY